MACQNTTSQIISTVSINNPCSCTDSNYRNLLDCHGMLSNNTIQSEW